jgi:hypothetical protein
MSDASGQNLDHLFDAAWKSMNQELSGESERAAAIVGCALLDERLAELLAEFLVQNADGRADLLSSEDVNVSPRQLRLEDRRIVCGWPD